MKTKSPRHGLRAARRARILARAIFLGLPLGIIPLATRAANGSWNVDASGNWTTASNWSGSVIAGNNAGDVADLTFNITAARTVTVDGSNKIIGVLNVGDPNNTHSYTLGGGTAVYFNNGSSDAQINQLSTSKGDTINAPLGIIGNGNLRISNASSNTLTVGGYTQAGNSGALSLTLDTGSGAIDYKGPIVNGSGTLSVVKNGSGILKLTGTAGNSTYSGGFTLNAGTLEFGYSQTALGTGTFTINAGVITNGYGAARTNANNNAQVWAANFAFGTTGGSGQDLNLGSGAVSLTGNRTVTVNSTNSARALTVGGNISGSGYGLTKAGAATLVLNGANTYSGPTTVTAGTLRLGQRASLYNGSTASWTAANLVVNSGASAVFNVGGSGEFTASDIDILKSLGTSSGGFRNGSVLGLDTTNASGGAFFYSSAIANPNGGANALSLVKSGANSLVLGGANTHSGGTTLNAGTLAVNHASALGTGALVINGGALDNTSGSPVTVSTGNSQNWNGNFAFVGTNDLNLGSGAVALGASRIVTVQTSALTVGGVISGASRGITLAGNGSLVLDGANTYSGPVVINGGILVASTLANGGASSSVGASSNAAVNLVLDGGALRYTGPAASTDRALTLGAGSGTLDASGSGPISFTNADALVLSGADTARTLTLTGSNTGANTLAAVITDNGSGATSLVKSGSGTWTLDGANTYSGGTVVSGGTLVVGATGSLGSGGLSLTGGAVVLGNASAISDHSTLAFSPSMGAGSIDLAFSGVKSLDRVTDGVKYAVAGTYTAAQLNTFFGTTVFTGTGSLTVGSWVSVPLGGGGYVTGLACDSTGNDIYARTDVGGVFRWVPTTGGNGAWLSITDMIVPVTTPDTAALLFTSSVAVDPSNSNNLYISVGSPSASTTRGIYASTDRGASWARINPSDDIVMDGNGTYRLYGERLAVDPNNPGIVWFGSTQQGLYKGVKSGSTWTWTQIASTSVPFGAVASTTSGKAGVTFVACDSNGGATIVYAGVFDNTTSATGGVYRSTDGGATWAKVSGVTVGTPARGQIAPDGSLYVTSGNVVARLPRGGSLAAITPNSAYNYRAVAVDPSDATGNTVYAAEGNNAAQYNRIWRSTDGGASWTTQYQNLNDNRAIARSEPDGTPCVTGYWFGGTSSMLVAPGSANTLWAADAFGVARTQNADQLGGTAVGSQAIWYMLQVNQEETYVEALKNAPTGPQLMTALADVGGYRYNDISQRPVGAAGNAFTTPADANTNSLDFCESDPSVWVRAWTGTVGNGTTNGFYGSGAHSRDGGQSWIQFGEIDRRNMTGAAGWETFDLAAYLAAQKAKGVNIVTLMLSSGRASNGSGSVQIFASKENGTVANRPTLLVNGVTSLSPTDDATVFGQYPTGNYKSSGSYGYAGTFDIFYNAGDNAWYRHAYLKFDLSGVSTITSATLRLYRTSTANGFTVPVGVFACADTTWTQDTLIWNNRPMPYASNIGQPFYAPRYTTGAGLTIGGGRVAVSSTNPNQMVWMPLGTTTVPHYSNDRGVTWTPCSGLPANVNCMISKSNPSYLLNQLASDRVDGSFYIWHLYDASSYKRIYKSTDGGATWTNVGSVPYVNNYTNNVWRCQIVAAPAAGHVWMADDGISNTAKGGLWKTVNGGTSSVQLANISGVRVVSFGKPPAGSSSLYSAYFMGYYNGVKGVYRSDDYGSTWTALPGLPSVGNVDSIAGDRQVHGSVFIGVGGRGVFQTQ